MQVPTGKPGRPWYKKWWVWAIAVVVVIAYGQAAANQPTRNPQPVVAAAATATAQPQATQSAIPSPPPSTSPAATTAPATTSAPAAAPDNGSSKYGAYPGNEAAFISEVEAARAKYEEANTDLQRSQVLRARDRQLVSVLLGRKVSNWVGVIKDVGANGEGKAYVSIEIADGISVKTWNNAFSDIGDGTLIPEGGAMFNNLVAASPGDKVVFSGSFLADSDDPVKVTNITETFTILTPEFLMKFSSISKG